MAIERCCAFRPSEIVELQSEPGVKEVLDWHKENCRCVKEGFDEFYCKYWEYSPEERQSIQETRELAAEQAKLRACNQ